MSKMGGIGGLMGHDARHRQDEEPDRRAPGIDDKHAQAPDRDHRSR
ncbi:MAG: hypothetical protein MZV49_03790 [Rhodopseudomonas palustris]|nr:hypothetical protein [Rhodopseudomonas palustris]